MSSTSDPSVTDPPSAAGPSRAVIIACATVGGLLALLAAARLAVLLRRWCCSARKRNNNSTRPLPPARPLSVAVRFHGVSLGQPHSRPGSYYASYAGPPSTTMHARALASVPSLTAYSSAEDGDLEKKASASLLLLNTGGGLAMSEETAHSSTGPPTPLDNDTELVPPQPAFIHAAAGKFGVSGEGGSRPASIADSDYSSFDNVPASTFPTSKTQSTTMSGDVSFETARGAPSQPATPTRGPRPRTSSSRPLSQAFSVASASSLHTQRSASVASLSVLRGAPHSRHSRVEIVLPAPLAAPVPESGSGWGQVDSNAYPYSYTASANPNRASLPPLPMPRVGSSRLSVCDPWLAASRENGLNLGDTATEVPQRQQRRSSRGPDGERSSSRSRSSRRLSASSTSSSQSPSFAVRPPVPRIPSMFNSDAPP